MNRTFTTFAWTSAFFFFACMLASSQDLQDIGPAGTNVLLAEQTPVPPAPVDINQSAQPPGNTETVPVSQQQPKRILGVMPNFRAVTAGTHPPAPNWRQAFKLATQNSFDYSSILFVGFTSATADAQGAHKALGHGLEGYRSYYWHGFLDKTDGNYLVLFALPGIFHEDERYYAMGRGKIAKRATYAATRVFITPDYHGHNTLNISELLGRGIAQGISATYYPHADRTAGALATRWGYAIMRDACTQMFREFWPDIATHVLHRHP